MKQSILLSLFILVHAPILGMSDTNGTVSSACRGLSDIVYNVGKHIGPNDFLYLARENSVWFLRKKLQSREYFEERDTYYVGIGRRVGQTDISIYHTPLHAAVEKGNIEIVKLLCAVGANVHKEIKSAQEIRSGQISFEPEHALYFSLWDENGLDINSEAKKLNTTHHVGLSALELAKLMRANAKDKLSEREEIANFLIEYAKKN